MQRERVVILSSGGFKFEVQLHIQSEKSGVFLSVTPGFSQVPGQRN